MMEKLKMKTPDLADKNIEQIAKLFPHVITEIKDKDGTIKKAVDFDLLKQSLSDVLADDDDERYRLDWPGKKASLLKANTPITKTLRPCREESVDFDTTENLYIEGDNFEVLKILQESYLGKIKMIYIDPPYNTGKDFIYKDDFKVGRNEYEEEIGAVDEDGDKLFKNTDSNGRFHSDWLSMMYERLIVSRDFLREDGVVFISIDDNEVRNITKLCDEVFGEDNHIATLTIINNMKGRNDKANIATCHEYLSVYSKNKFISNGLPMSKEQLAKYKYTDKNGNKYALRDLRKRGRPDRREDRPNMYFPIFYNESKKTCSLQGETDEDIEIVPLRGDGSDGRWRWGVDTVKKNLGILQPKYLKQKDKWGIEHRVYLNIKNDEDIDEESDDGDQEFLRTSKSKSFWWGGDISTDVANREFKKIFNDINPDYPKSPFFIEKLIHMGIKNDDIVMDFFAGSATTAHAVMQLNAEDNGKRKFIMVQLPEKTDEKSEAHKAGYETIAEIGKERIRRAGKKIKEDLEKKNRQLKLLEDPVDSSRLDTGFRVYKTASTNMKDVYYHPDKLGQMDILDLISNIKEDRAPEDLLTQVILDLGLTLDLPIETKEILGNTVFIVQTNALVACFDKNINFKIIDEIAALKPFKAVFKDAGFVDDKDRINVEERFKRLSPETAITVI
ncbi:conserved hypothetical protein [Candidatus Desulfarcum epimagneticum]|uniref:site-specific DNA-methyltransferase (adenine-specific) n=1 Tax=uncultured Desulfobacteraceae bacterium TaxID=218296 RepID=A0A484HH83_9BACT|nr:conserved hypothetical protein [uncultured Desulfobacteraceae bacterium]